MLSYIWFPFIISAFAGYMFMSLAPLTDQFMALFGVGFAGLSLFLSALLWSHSLVALPAGLVLDRLGVYRGFLIGTVIALAACLFPFIAPDNLALAIGLRFVGGISTGMLFLAGVKITGMMAPPEKLAHAQGVQGAAFSLGAMLPFVTLPFFGENAWRFSYWIPAVLATLVFAASLKLPAAVRTAGSASTSTASDLWAAVKSIATSVPIWALGIFHGLSYGTLNNLGQWLPSILADMDGRGEVAAWSLGTGVVLLVGTLGRAFGGTLLRWCSRSFLTNTAVLLIGILYIALGLTGNAWVGLGVGMVLAILGGANYGSIFSLTSQAVSPVYMATAAGFMNMIANLTNVTLTVLLGTLREYTGSFSMTLSATGVFALLAWLAGWRIIRKMGN